MPVTVLDGAVLMHDKHFQELASWMVQSTTNCDCEMGLNTDEATLLLN